MGWSESYMDEQVKAELESLRLEFVAGPGPGDPALDANADDTAPGPDGEKDPRVDAATAR